ncbi:MAG: hypothetical protein JXJ04_03185 [Spirochaetales bacterium]|nr:hypothetical protein [Spirochaetales bacterium]
MIDFTKIGSTKDYVYIDKDIPADKEVSYIYRVYGFKGKVTSGYSNEVRTDIGKKEIPAVPSEKENLSETQNKPTHNPEATTPPLVSTPKPTATPITKTEPGTVWLVPDSLQVRVGTNFTTGIHVNTGAQRIAAYGILVEYSDSLLDVNRNIGSSGVIGGSDGFVAAVNAKDPGVLFISGMDPYGRGPSEDLHLITIQWKALNDGVTKIALSIRDLNDEKTKKISNLKIINGIVTIIKEERSAEPEIVYNDYRWNPEKQNDPEIRDTSSQDKDSSNNNTYNDNANNNDNNDSNYSNDKDEPYYDEYPTEPPLSYTEVPYEIDRPTARPGTTEIPTSRPTNPPRATATPKPDATSAPERTQVPTATAKKTAQPTTPPAPPGAGNVWIEPVSQTVSVGSSFTAEVHVNSGSQRLAAYGFKIRFNTGILEIDKSSGSNGVTAGPDGFLAAANSSNPGELKVAGFDAMGKGPGRDLYVLKVFFNAVGHGNASISIIIENLVDGSAEPVGNPNSKNGTVKVE